MSSGFLIMSSGFLLTQFSLPFWGLVYFGAVSPVPYGLWERGERRKNNFAH